MSEASYRDVHAGLDPQTVAERVAAGMYANDRAAQGLGIRIDAVGPDRARVVMTVREEMTNGFGILHGGILTTLADTAFAYACNSGNEMTVASSISSEFFAPTRPGDELIAEAKAVVASGRTGVYDVTVTKRDGTLVAIMRGRSYRFRGRPVVEIV